MNITKTKSNYNNMKECNFEEQSNTNTKINSNTNVIVLVIH